MRLDLRDNKCSKISQLGQSGVRLVTLVGIQGDQFFKDSGCAGGRVQDIGETDREIANCVGVPDAGPFNPSSQLASERDVLNDIGVVPRSYSHEGVQLNPALWLADDPSVQWRAHLSGVRTR
jgi:hypothetical protein